MFQHLETVTFTELIEHNIDVMTIFSPNGLTFASAVQCQLIIWSIDSKEILQKFICDHPIDNLEWSQDSELIFCNMLKQNVIQVWNLANPSWKCKINESPLAIAGVYWAPDSRHLLVVSEFHIKITVWSLVSSTIAVIENPKAVKKCVSFSHCASYLAVAEKKKYGEFIGIYTCKTWENLTFFPLETKDLVGIYFSPSDLVIGVLEAAMEEYKVLFYSIDGRLLAKYGKVSNFGLTSFSWSSNGKFISVGDYIGEVTVLHNSNYGDVISYKHSENIDSENVVIYRVVPKPAAIKYQTTSDRSSNWELYEVVKERPVSLSSTLKDYEKTKSKRVKYGIQNLQYSNDGQYIASVNGSSPNLLFIFDMKKLKVSDIIVHHRKIKCVSWHPEKPILAICSGSSSLDLWTPACFICFISPFKEEFSINNASWCLKRDCVILNGKENSSILYLPQVSIQDCLSS